MGYGDIRDEWRLADIERKLSQKAESNELHAINSNVDSLEYSVREFSSAVDELRAKCQEHEERILRLTEIAEGLLNIARLS